MAYLDPAQRVFSFISQGDRAGVKEVLDLNIDLQKRDHVGRTPLHLAILCQEVEIACDLITAGARVSARVADGRTCLHIAAQLGLGAVVKTLLERSDDNKVVAEQKIETADIRGVIHQSEEEVMEVPTEQQEGPVTPALSESRPKKTVIVLGEADQPDTGDQEETDERPDILDLAAMDWDNDLTALGFAIVGGHLSVVKILIAAGVDVNFGYQRDATRRFLCPLSLTFLIEDEDVACEMAKTLIIAGSRITAVDPVFKLSWFHSAVILNKVRLAETMLHYGPNSSVAINFLADSSYVPALHPLVSAARESRAMTAMLLVNGSFPVITEADYAAAKQANPSGVAHYRFTNFRHDTPMPVETSIRHFNHTYELLITLGAEINLALKRSDKA